MLKAQGDFIKMSDEIAICLATYNGQKYLKEQIKSILNQDNKNWHLYIRDDGSNDETTTIIDKYESLFPNKITNLTRISGGGNSKKNFLTVLKWVKENVNPRYVMLCDQDDYWLPNKITVTLNKLSSMSGPALVHTNLKVVDGKLNEINKSFEKYSKLNSNYKTIQKLVIQNNVTGCTMMWNRSLNNLLSFNDDKRLIMHDWWIALLAASFGQIIYIDEPTILYRQHESNVVGASQVNSIGYIKEKLREKNMHDSLVRTYNQAKKLEEEYQGSLPLDIKKFLCLYSKMNEYSKLKRISVLFKYKVFKQSFMQVIGELLFI